MISRSRMTVALATATAAMLVTAAPAAAAPPANDNFGAAQVVGPALPVSVAGTTVDATRETGEPQIDNGGGGGFGAEHTAWYSWTPASSGTALVHTCTSDFDTTLGVYTGNAVNALTTVGQSDDECAQPNALGSAVQFSAVAGTPYRIQVGGYDTAEAGTFTLAIAAVVQTPPTVTPVTPLNPSTGAPPPGQVKRCRKGQKLSKGKCIKKKKKK